jgi:hypothetical protein
MVNALVPELRERGVEAIVVLVHERLFHGRLAANPRDTTLKNRADGFKVAI